MYFQFDQLARGCREGTVRSVKIFISPTTIFGARLCFCYQPSSCSAWSYTVTKFDNRSGTPHDMRQWAKLTFSNAISITLLDTNSCNFVPPVATQPVTMMHSIYWKSRSLLFLFQCILMVHRADKALTGGGGSMPHWWRLEQKPIWCSTPRLNARQVAACQNLIRRECWSCMAQNRNEKSLRPMW